ncbi:MAG TPA: CopG family transcriptional regulator [Chthoniobacterales bacterium]|nr:CopG family transcriptional regulator [Chthoniobacterales bacterium]
MAEGKPIPVRLDATLIARLDAVARRMGTNKSALIRFLAKSFCDHFESHGGITSLPHNWREILREQDGRSEGQKGRFPHLRAAEDSPRYDAKRKGRK